jgi:hypothetical protein
MVDLSVQTDGADLGGERPLLVLVEVRRHPGVEDDERRRVVDRRHYAPEVGEHVPAFEARGVPRAANVRQGGAQSPEADRVVRPLAGEKP